MNKLSIFFFVFFGHIAFSQTTSSDSLFQELLDANHMEFTAPNSYKEIDCIENRQMNYERAYKHPKEKFEVRYAIRSHDLEIAPSVFQATVMNISGEQLPKRHHYPMNPEAVQKELGADYGATVMVEVGEEFGQDYVYCLLVFIHKKGIGDAYIFYLADDPALIPELMRPIFHSLNFKQK